MGTAVIDSNILSSGLQRTPAVSERVFPEPYTPNEACWSVGVVIGVTHPTCAIETKLSGSVFDKYSGPQEKALVTI